jgi:hypothetical protein
MQPLLTRAQKFTTTVKLKPPRLESAQTAPVHVPTTCLPRILPSPFRSFKITLSNSFPYDTYTCISCIPWTIGVLGFDSRRRLRILLFTTAFKTALGPTRPPIQWVTGSLSLGIKRPGREADHSPPSSAEAKECVELYIQSPNMPSWRGA